MDHGILVLLQRIGDHVVAAFEAHRRELQSVTGLRHEAEVAVDITDGAPVAALGDDAGEGHRFQAVARDHDTAELHQPAALVGLSESGERKGKKKEKKGMAHRSKGNGGGLRIPCQGSRSILDQLEWDLIRPVDG